MARDELTDLLMTSYNETAGKLSRGETISEDDLRKFLGLTGLMQVQMQNKLWTQSELEKQIDERMEKRCTVCPNSKAIAVLTAAAPEKKEISAEEKEPFNFKRAALQALLANMKTAIITVGLVVALLGTCVIFTRQISEAAGFVDSTAQAAIRK